MDDQFSTGQASRLLRVSQAKALRWCTEGLIECTTTAGGHYRIPQSAIAAIQKHGEPELPRRSARVSTGRPVSQRNSPPPPSGLYRDASDQLAQSAESVQIVANRVQRRRLELEDAELEDQFEERARRKAAEDAENRRLVAAAQAEQDHRQWLQGKLAYALEPRTVSPNIQLLYLAAGLTPDSEAGFPQKAPAELKQAVHDAVLKLLRNSDRNTLSDAMVNNSIRNTVRTFVQEYKQRQNEIRRAQQRAQQEAEQRRQLNDLNTAVEIARLFVGGSRPAPAPQSLAAPPAPQITARPEPPSFAAEAESQARRRADAYNNAEPHLGHINTYLTRSYEFSNGWRERREEAARLRPLVRERLVDALTRRPDMNAEDMRAFIEQEIDKGI